MFEVGVLRNTALAEADAYEKGACKNKEFNMLDRIKAVVGEMPYSAQGWPTWLSAQANDPPKDSALATLQTQPTPIRILRPEIKSII